MVISNLIIFSLLLVLLRVIYTRTQKLGITVLIGLLLGVICGVLLQQFATPMVIKPTLEWINLVGNGYVRLLQMIVMPLVFVSILSAITRLNQASALGKISLSVISVLLITTAIAAAIGIAMTYAFDLTAEGLIAGERACCTNACSRTG